VGHPTLPASWLIGKLIAETTAEGNRFGLKSIFLGMRNSLGLPWFGTLYANLVPGGI
jgi:hypothetical protein